MLMKTSISFFAAGAIALGAAGLAHGQAYHSSGIVLVAQAKDKDHKDKKTHAQKTGGNKTQTKKFGGQKSGHKSTITINNKKTFTGNKTKKQKSGTIVVKPKTTVRVVHPKRVHSKTVTTKSLRGLSATGVGHATIKGHRYSTWRHGRYRRRYHNAWITFVPLSVLAAILFDERQYYPYAYIDAPEDFCDGRTEDGCQLVWDDVETEEGEPVGQCVAYCPWRD
jgi:hypothetical protein